MEPAYLKAYRENILQERIETALSILTSCVLCPRKCNVNRLKDELGVCRIGRYATVSSYGPHFGEEEPLVGRNGSGTIFFTHCSLRCVFCQNYAISHQGEGYDVKPAGLAAIMVGLRSAKYTISTLLPRPMLSRRYWKPCPLQLMRDCMFPLYIIPAAMTVLQPLPCWTISLTFTCLI